MEYGPGSGQTLLMLARLGVKCFGVDIDEASLNQVRKQALELGLTIELERALFGHGFDSDLEPMRFDRILFFEAFHHEINFELLLLRLHSRLSEGGRVVFCGEPIVPVQFAGIFLRFFFDASDRLTKWEITEELRGL